MPRKSKKYHVIYKTTNLINEKFYVGMHSTDNLNDGYMGSGRYLKRSIKKYGANNFKIEYLEYLCSKEKLIEREKAIVTKDFIKNPLCMNLQVGGLGAPDGNWGAKRSEETKKRMSAWKRTPEMCAKMRLTWLGRKHKKESCDKMSQTRKGTVPCNKGKNHTKESIEKMRQVKGGVNNPHYGKIWVHKDGEVPTRIDRNELLNMINLGWAKGRGPNTGMKRGQHHSIEVIENMRSTHPGCKRVVITDINNVEKEFMSVNDAVRFTGITKTTVRKYCKLGETVNGYTWKFKINPK